MKHVALFSALLVVGGIYGASVQAADGTINFKGSLTAAPCSIDGANSNQTIDFGVVSTASFGDIGSVGPSKPFKIELTGCDTSTYKSAAVRFDGTAATGAAELLSTDNDGLAIELIDASGTRVKLASASSSVNLNLATSSAGAGGTATSNIDGSAVLSFRARYSALKKSTAMKPGPANATAAFTVAYK